MKTLLLLDGVLGVFCFQAAAESVGIAAVDKLTAVHWDSDGAPHEAIRRDSSQHEDHFYPYDVSNVKSSASSTNFDNQISPLIGSGTALTLSWMPTRSLTEACYSSYGSV